MDMFLVGLIGLLAGIVIGIVIERIRWNKLIEAGLIPRPKTRAGVPYVPRKS